MKQTLDRQFLGLHLHTNAYTAPEGALFQADNVVVDEPGVLSKMRGVNRYGSALSAPGSALGEFEEKLVVLDGTTIKYDSDGVGTLASVSGTHTAPTGYTMRFVESLWNLYFTTADGVKRLDSFSNAPARGGMPKGLDVQVEHSAGGSGWMGLDTQVAYKILWGRTLENGQEVVGAPSERTVHVNAWATGLAYTRAGTTITVAHDDHGYSNGSVVSIRNATHPVQIPDGDYTITSVDNENEYTFTAVGTPAGSGTLDDAQIHDTTGVSTIPDEIVAGDWYEYYRTEQSAGSTVDPGGIYYLVRRTVVTSADITAGEVSGTDDLGDAFLGEQLYTNGTAEGGSQANYRPPHAADIALWKGHLWYANTWREHELVLDLVDETGLVDDTSSLTLTDGTTTRTYTFTAGANDTATQKFHRHTGATTSAENIRITMQNFAHVVNRDAGQSVWYAEYISGANDVPGQVRVYARGLDDTSLSLTCDASTTGDNFSPQIPTSGTTYASDHSHSPNGLWYSKRDEPDAVPLFNDEQIGSRNEAILRVVPLRDSLIVFSERNIYRVSGEDPASFDIRLLETGVRLLAANSCAVLNDQVFCYTTQGVTAVDENGAKVVSFQGIEDELNRVQSFQNWNTLMHGLGYERARHYMLFTQRESGDTTCTVAYVYNHATKQWTRRVKAVSSAIVLKEGDRYFATHAVDSTLLKERLTYSNQNLDFVDEDIAGTVTAVGTTTAADGDTVTQVTVTWTYEDVTVNHLFSQGSSWHRIAAVTDNGSNSWTLTLDGLGVYTTGACNVSLPLISTIRTAPEIAGNFSAKKQFNYATVTPEDDDVAALKLGFSSDTTDYDTWLSTATTPEGGWGDEAWGDAPWGSAEKGTSTPIRVPVPRDHRRCGALQILIEHSLPRAGLKLLGFATEVRVPGPRISRGYDE